jgi:hypothetical protein
METELFERFAPRLRHFARNEIPPPELLIQPPEGRYAIYYVPFEYVNAGAKLVLVGITPGPEQIRLASDAACLCIGEKLPSHEILRRAKAAAGFGGSMRERLIKILDYLRIPQFLGIEGSATLWGEHQSLVHTTSILRYATFQDGKTFNGPFEKIAKCRFLLDQFQRSFVTELEELSPDAVFLAMGPVPYEALEWCTGRNVIRTTQILGRIPHPSSKSGSAVPYFLGEKHRNDLKPRDPVRRYCDRLDADRKAIRERLAQLIGNSPSSAQGS